MPIVAEGPRCAPSSNASRAPLVRRSGLLAEGAGIIIEGANARRL